MTAAIDTPNESVRSTRHKRLALALTAIAATTICALGALATQYGAVAATGASAGKTDASAGKPAPASLGSTAPATTGSAGESATGRLRLEQLKLDRAAARIEAVSRSARGAGFAGTAVSIGTRRLTVYWKGTPSPAAGRLIGQLRVAGTAVTVRSAPYSRTQLDARAQFIMAHRASYLRSGITVDGLFPRQDGSGVDVGVRTAKRAATGSLPDVGGGAINRIPAFLVAQPAPTPLDRLSDYVPHWAGARIDSNSSSCTSGFPIVRNSDGRTFILTAGHCTGTPWYAAVIPDTLHDYKFGDTWTVSPGLDIQYIRSFVQGATYDGGVKPGTEFSKPVVGTSGNQSGDSVCQSGAWTGIHCGMTIVQHGYEWINGSFVPGWTACQPSGLLCSGTDAGEGDSGAPVFSLAANPGDVLARGSVSLGLNGGFSCHNNNNESDTCFDEIFFVDIQDILNNYGAHILTW
jgi:hypothetical protein